MQPQLLEVTIIPIGDQRAPHGGREIARKFSIHNLLEKEWR